MLMKRYIFIIFLLLVSNNALAQWTYIEHEDERDMFYVDFDTMKTEGNVVTIWEYVDYPKAKKNETASISAKVQYDCKNEMSRQLFIATYKQNKLKGTPYNRGKYKSEWEEVAPYTVGGKVLRMVCAKIK